METIKKNWLLLITVALAILLASNIVYYKMLKDKNRELTLKLQESENLQTALQDTLYKYKGADSLNRARILVLTTSNSKTFLELQTKDKTILELQALVKKLGLTKPGNTGVIIEGETKFDTVYISTGEGEEKNIREGFSNEWVTMGFSKVDKKVGFTLKTREKYTLVIGMDKDNKTYADITNHSPYSETTVLRVYQVAGAPKVPPKKFGIGPSVGAVFTGNGIVPGIGITLNYNVIRW